MTRTDLGTSVQLEVPLAVELPPDVVEFMVRAVRASLVKSEPWLPLSRGTAPGRCGLPLAAGVLAVITWVRLIWYFNDRYSGWGWRIGDALVALLALVVRAMLAVGVVALALFGALEVVVHVAGWPRSISGPLVMLIAIALVALGTLVFVVTGGWRLWFVEG